VGQLEVLESMGAALGERNDMIEAQVSKCDSLVTYRTTAPITSDDSGKFLLCNLRTTRTFVPTGVIIGNNGPLSFRMAF
jgi:hypothetical protein